MAIICPSVDDTLDERGRRYGKFVDVSKATIAIQSALYDQFHPNKLNTMPDDVAVALDMICHKMARIAVGDMEYIDNWIDIAGYAQLVGDRLRGLER